MKKRLGSILLEEGLIDKAQLEDALRVQRERGGRLGSILIQLGYIDADTLSKILKEQLNLETVNPEDIEHLDYEVINSIPKDLVEEYMVLPVKVREGEIEVAMLDPRDTQAISELSFFLDKEVIPLIIPEGMLYRALKKYYNIDVEPEEEVVEEIVIPEVSTTGYAAPEIRMEPKSPPPAAQVDEGAVIPPASREVPPAADRGPHEAAVPPRPSAPEGFADEPLVVEEAEEVEEVPDMKVEPPVKEEVESVVPPPVSPPETEPEEIPSRGRSDESVFEEWVPTPPPVEIDEKQILEAKNMDDLAYKLARLISGKAARGVVFKVMRNTAFGWVGKGEKIVPSIVDILMVPLCVPSIFKTANDTGETFFGPPPMDDPILERVMKAFDSYIKPPETIILTPVKVHSKTVLFLYLDNGPGKNFEDLRILPEINRIAETASEAVERIIASRKRH